MHIYTCIYVNSNQMHSNICAIQGKCKMYCNDIYCVSGRVFKLYRYKIAST